MKKRIVIYIVLAELIIAGAIGICIFKKQTKVASVNKLSSKSFNKVNIDGLKYYYEPKPGVEVVGLDWDNTNGPQNPVYKINKDTLNQVSDYPVSKPKGVFRIVTLGDSFTFGANVNTETNYPSQLQQILDNSCTQEKFQVLNLGVSGFDIRYAVERFKLRGQKYNPDLLLWFILDDDLRRVGEKLIPAEEAILAEMKKTGEYEENVKKGLYYLHWSEAVIRTNNELGGEENVFKLQKEYARNLNKFFKKSSVIFTYNFNEDKYKKVLKEMANNLVDGHYYDDAPNTYQIEGAHLPDTHPSPLGHKLIAQNIFEYLTHNKLITCTQ